MRGELVTIRPLIKEDSQSYFQWINNKELVLFNAAYKPISQMEHDIWFENIQTDKNIVIFSIVENQTQKLIGNCSLRNINWQELNAELQIRIGDFDYHSKGYGSDAIKLLVNHGMFDLNLKRIYLHVFCNNTRAIRAYEKCGFIKEGMLKKAAFIEGQYLDLMVMVKQES